MLLKNLFIFPIPFILDCQCPTIKLNLSKKAEYADGFIHATIQGTYNLSETVNGKQSWVSISESTAIWYDQTFKAWHVGALSKIGTSKSFFFTKDRDDDCPQQVPNGMWKYYVGGQEVKARSSDINVHCDNTR